MKRQNPVIVALIVAGGSGERFGGTLPKQYQPLLGKPVLAWSLEAFQKHPLISKTYTVIHPAHKDLFQQAAAGINTDPPVIGGDNRQQSVRKGLEHLRTMAPDIVLIHDAARPLITESLITSLCETANAQGAAIPAIMVTDSLKRQTDAGPRAESRDQLYTVQTPQAFHFSLIDSLHQKYQDQSLTDDAALCEAGSHPVTLVQGTYDNIKITHAADIMRAEQYLAARLGDIRTGQGYDVHRLIPRPDTGRELMICGIAIPHDKVLEGHSDADVGLHAITDAILGTICDGDIGLHFNPKDMRWKDADSAVFLKHAANLVTHQGGVITHVDVTLICEAPKISPYRPAMRQRIAEILQLPLQRVSVKATTTEGLGFTGRQEGIAAQSVVTVRLPFTTGAVMEKP